MRGILRGLSNAIFRKLPIKLLLILLAVFSVLFAFVRADCTQKTFLGSFTLRSYSSDTSILDPGTSLCFFGSSSTFNSSNINYDFGGQTDIPVDNNLITCVYADGEEGTLIIKNISSSNISITFFRNYCSSFNGVFINENNCPISSQSVCESSYSLIPISSVDSNYCSINGFCPSSGGGDCPSGTGDINWSSLFINNIQHYGAGIINITIPEEISWDYTNNNNIFDLDIEGYNVDPDYINAIIGTQTYTPNSNDFSKVVSDIIPLFVPGLVVILFLYFVFRFIKKIF